MKKYISIAGALIFAYCIVKISTPQVFLHNSPSIDPAFIARLKNLPSTTKEVGQVATLFATNVFFGKKSGTQPQTPASSSLKNTIAGTAQETVPMNLVFSPITKGVAAAEDVTTKKKYVQLKKNTAYHIEKGGLTINGKAYDVVIFDE